jgi:hypothetical protein
VVADVGKRVRIHVEGAAALLVGGPGLVRGHLVVLGVAGLLDQRQHSRGLRAQ